MHNKEHKWKHDELQSDLAHSLYTLYQNVCLGSAWNDGGFDHTTRKFKTVQRADVLKVVPSYTRYCFMVYEVKVSRADFLSDIRSGKWKGYLNFANRFYFATPAGLVDKSEIPDGAGLYVRGEKGWSCTKNAQPRDIELTQNFLLSLIFYRRGEYRHAEAYRRYFHGATFEDMRALGYIYRRKEHEIVKKKLWRP